VQAKAEWRTIFLTP